MRGLCLIIDIETFRDGKNRNGSDLDSSNISALFKQFGFEIMLTKNLSENDIQEALEDLRTKHKGRDFEMVSVFVLSHGSRNSILSPDGRKDHGCVIETSDNKFVSFLVFLDRFYFIDTLFNLAILLSDCSRIHS